MENTREVKVEKARWREKKGRRGFRGIRRRRSAGRVSGMDGEAQTGGSMPGLGDALGRYEPVQERAMEGMLVALQLGLRWRRPWR